MFNNNFYCTLDLKILDKQNKKYNLFNEANNTIETSLIDNTKPLTVSIWCDINPDIVVIPKILFNNEELLRFNLSTVVRKNQIYSITIYKTESQIDTESNENSDEESSVNNAYIVSSDIYNNICNFTENNVQLIHILKMKITQLGRHSSYTPNKGMFTLNEKNIKAFECFGLSPKPYIYHEYISDKLHYFYDKYKNNIYEEIIDRYTKNYFLDSSQINDETPSRKILLYINPKGYSLICHKTPHKYIGTNNIIYHIWRLKVKHGPIVSRNYIEIIVGVDYENKTAQITNGYIRNDITNSNNINISQSQFDEIFT